MTQSEFNAWLDGFLDGKLAAEDMAKVRAKAAEVVNPPSFGWHPGPVIPLVIPDTSPLTVPGYPGWWPNTCGGSLTTAADPRVIAWNEAGGNA